MHVSNAFVTFIAFAVTTSAAMAITSSEFIYDKPQVRVYSISPEEMTPSNSGNTYLRSGFSLVNLSPDRACYTAGLHIPDGAIVTKLRVSADNLQDQETTVAFVARTGAEDDTPVAQVSLAASGAVELEDGDPQFPRMDNSRFVYRFGVCLSQNERFVSARVTYKFKSAGD